LSLSVLQAVVVFIFLLLGGLLYLFAISKGATFEQVMVDGKATTHFLLDGKNVLGDNLFPQIAFNYLPSAIGIIFIIGLISALFPSADGALTALTSSFCIDIIGLKRRDDWDEAKKKKTRMTVHFSFAIIFFICIMVFKIIDDKSIIDIILKVAGYTYGPLLGLFSFGILTRRKITESIFVPLICLLAPLLCYILAENAGTWFGGFQIGIELLILNGLLTFLGLLAISKKNDGIPDQYAA
jgi:Na+/proline symporter